MPPTASEAATTAMSDDTMFDSPDADVILRALGPPERDFRVHRILLSLASPVFKDMFSLPQPTTTTASDSNKSDMVDVIEVTDPPHALDIVLQMVYPFPPPSYDGDLDVLVDCLTIADKYQLEGAMSRLRGALSRVNVSQALRVYAIASRFGFTDLVEAATRHILPSVNLAAMPQLPRDFDFLSVAAYQKLVRRRARYLEAVVETIKQTPVKSGLCVGCSGGHLVEVFRLRLSHLIMKGTPVEVADCFDAWTKAYGRSAKCVDDCDAKFIRTAISRVSKLANAPKPILKKT